jgi:hypothetical protein
MKLTKQNVEYIQSACNPLAVANTLAEWQREIFDANNSMTEVRQNRLLRAVVGKLCDLYGIDHDGTYAYEIFGEIKQ